MGTRLAPISGPPFDDALVDKALSEEESYTFDCKRIKENLTKILETIVAFANSDGGTIALGLEDPGKATGRDRV
ncbi:MAG TPA: ATP-binding protein, partial [Pirellulales bacterium]|nr:ATP-binding protein [Pirellulales bacterium]